MSDTTTLRHLADAMDALKRARNSTGNGITDDVIGNAMDDVRTAMAQAVADEPQEIEP